MIISTPNSTTYTTRRSRRRDPSLSPSIGSRTTPQKAFPSQIPTYNSPMFTPSPIKQRSLFSGSDSSNLDDLFLDSPYRSPTLAHSSRPEAMCDENDGIISLNMSAESPTSFSSTRPMAPSPASGTCYTPLKASQSDYNGYVFDPPDSTSELGNKRKSCSTPLRQHSLTPLRISSRESLHEKSFQTLVPPLFSASRPKAPREHPVAPQTDIMDSLSLSDLRHTSGRVPAKKTARRSDGSTLLNSTGPSSKAALNRSWGSSTEDSSVSSSLAKRRGRPSRPPGKDPTHRSTSISPPRKRAQNSDKKVPFLMPTMPANRHAHAEPSYTRKRLPAMPGKSNIPTFTNKPQSHSSRAPMQRNESAATLFFGPKIEVDDFSKSDQQVQQSDAWTTIQAKQHSSPATSPSRSLRSHPSDEDEEMADGSFDSSFQFSLTSGTPSPKKKIREPIPSKYHPRPSSPFCLSDTEDVLGCTGYTVGRSASMNLMPASSTSASSMSDYEDELVTPGVGPAFGSGWPAFDPRSSPESSSEESIEAFIKRTLTAAAKFNNDYPGGPKKAPGTPVKKNRTFLPGERPWQSAVANKVGRGPEFEPKKGKAPRKSMPATFGRKAGAGSMLLGDSDSDEEAAESPSFRKFKYPPLGLGRPSPAATPPEASRSGSERTRWLTRRSSSGAFSAGSDSSFPTPTRSRDGYSSKFSPRTPSSTSSSSISFASVSGQEHLQDNSFSIRTLDRSDSVAQEPAPKAGRFARDFVPVDEVGSGEFGQVIKVKNHSDQRLYAVKISKRFEGPRHRLRLHEEVDILEALGKVAKAKGHNPHPNVLGYIDSWEEDEKLYLRTELCDLGNFANFLWQYGRAYPRLDELRVWRIMAALANGLSFIHDAGIIHLDFKPANIFITRAGQFKIGDFGMASVWPRPRPIQGSLETNLLEGSFEREGDKLYLASEVLRGQYGTEADVFSFGMTMLETAYNIVVPGQGEAWHLLRQGDFSHVTLEGSASLFEVIRSMMQADAKMRPSCRDICSHEIVRHAQMGMEDALAKALREGSDVFAASPLGRGVISIVGGEPEAEGMDVEL